MRSSQLLFSAVQFIFTLLVLLVGGFFIGLHYAPHLRFAVAQFFIAHAESFIAIGMSVMGCGAFLLIGFYAMNRGSYLHFHIPAKNSEVEAAVIRGYIKKYWKGQFPENDLLADVHMRTGKKLEIALEMPPLKESDCVTLLKKVEKELSQLLVQSLGYQKDFLLTVLVK
ncbi:MAG TPA: hypothetical protein VGJ00_08660 [Rhabdochlamydiaceae bacterium]|jgi:hypothetical protein